MKLSAFDRADAEDPMKSLVMIVVVLTLCSLSFLAGRNTSPKRSFSSHSISHTNELDDLQQELASQK
jgi:hypothetical protein